MTKAYDWNSALAYCDSLSWGGHDDWRLPDRHELLSIVDRDQRSSAIDPAAFPATPSDWFRSSSSFAGSWSGAWDISFVDGYVGHVYYDDKPGTDYARGVRGGPRFDDLGL